MLLRASVHLVTGLCGVAVLAAEPDRPANPPVARAVDPAPPKRDPPAGKLNPRLTLVPPAGKCSIPLLSALTGPLPSPDRMPTVKPPKEGYAMRQAVMPAPPCPEARR